jgi:glutamine synthetase
MGDLYRSDSAPLALCPRGALKREMAAWQKHGLMPKVGIALEAFAMVHAPDGIVPYGTPGRDV